MAIPGFGRLFYFAIRVAVPALDRVRWLKVSGAIQVRVERVGKVSALWPYIQFFGGPKP